MFQSTPSGGKATSGLKVHPHGLGVSIHAFRGEGDDVGRLIHRDRKSFNPRLPGGRRRQPDIHYRDLSDVSIHAFRGEGDYFQVPTDAPVNWFQSTPSGGKATRSIWRRGLAMFGFNPRLPGGRRLARINADRIAAEVSIHAFRGEGDLSALVHVMVYVFQSTPSGGKATPCRAPFRRKRQSFNPRLPGGRRR